MKLLIHFGANIKNSIIRIILLIVMNSCGTVKMCMMVIVIYGIINTPYRSPKFLVL